ncbi:hypothetical protein [Shimia sp. SDUM112013]|uniref:hypothetical protein n=1 Tax=Shimia sp. SDUM112013 TaxID=3136160 RepID=UPI0032EE5104
MKKLTATVLLATLPVLAQAQPITSLTIHSEENRKHCNDGFTWSTLEGGMCLADNGR